MNQGFSDAKFICNIWRYDDRQEDQIEILNYSQAVQTHMRTTVIYLSLKF